MDNKWISLNQIKNLVGLTLAFILFLSFSACKKTNYEPGALEVTFSVDTFMFDTVFTEQGSSTRVLKIFNHSKKDVLIESISFQKQEQSPYTLNVNGQSGKSAENIKVLAQDSLYVFLRVFIDPTNEDNPFVVGDELIVRSSDGQKSLPILAFAQNAIYITDSVLQTQTWTAEKPYIILQNALIGENETLTIKEGVSVYMHADSRLFVMGSLKVEGSLELPVSFLGDRIDRSVFVGSHEDLPGEWGGIYIMESSFGNEIDYAIIKNGGNSTVLGESRVMAASIQIDHANHQLSQPKLRLTNSVIRSSLGYGILAFNSSLYMDNCIVAQCGAENVMFFEGGDYTIYNSTIGTLPGGFLANTSSYSLALLNFFPISETEYTSAPLKVDVENTIVYGHNEGEVLVNEKSDHTSQIKIHYSLIKIEEPLPTTVSQQGNIINSDPKFTDWFEHDFSLLEDSPAKGTGIQVGLNYDILGQMRTAPFTMGAIQ